MQFAVIHIADLSAHPDNPRKTFDEVGIQELADSIREKGVLQPILVRPMGDKYQVVCGERRFRATSIAGLEVIPATIRELNDEEALEAMLLENFQRQDVHPIEEAMGFAALRRMNRMSPSQIAAKVGKSHQYVTSRLKLANLIPELHEPFYGGKFGLKMALELSGFAPAVQKEWLDEQDAEDDEWGCYDDTSGIEDKDLNAAPFPLGDTKLVPEVGACVTCAHNTSTSLLFPELASARCMNPVCFDMKCLAVVMIEVNKAKEEGLPFILGYNLKDAFVDNLKGFEVLRQHSVRFERHPEEDDFFDDGQVYDSNIWDTTEEFEAYMKESAKAYSEALQQFAICSSSGEYRKALLVANMREFETVYLSTQPAASGSSGNQKIDVSTVMDRVKSGDAITTIEKSRAVDQLEREKEAAHDELAQKIFKEAKGLFADVEVGLEGDEDNEQHVNPVFLERSELSDVEIVAAIYCMLQQWHDEGAGIFVQCFLGRPAFHFEQWCLANDVDFADTDAAHAYALELLQDKSGRIPLKTFDHFQRAWMRYYIDKRIQFSAHVSSVNAGLAARLFVDFARYHFEEEMDDINKKHSKILNTKLKNIETKISLINKGI